MPQNQRFRILFVFPYYKPAFVYGGPVQCNAYLCEGLVEVGAEVTVFTTNANRGAPLHVPLQKPVDVNGVTVWYFPLSLIGLSFFYSRLLGKAVSNRVSEFDLVVLASLWGHSLIPTARACARSSVPYVIPTHGQLYPWALAKKKLKKNLYLHLVARRYLNRAAAIHCTDPTEVEAFERLNFRPPSFVVPNPIRASNFKHNQTNGKLRQQVGVPDGAAILIFLGRITQIKRADIAVDVLGAVQSLDREIHLVLVGPDEDGLTPRLQAQARDLGCYDKLHFTGLLSQEDVISALADANLLLMPSEIQENFGMSALEALAAGVPILVSEGIPVGRWAQIAGAGRVESSTKNAFQQAALELLSSPERLTSMGQRGQDLVRHFFDVKVVARQMLEQFRSIIAAGRPLPRNDFEVKPVLVNN